MGKTIEDITLIQRLNQNIQLCRFTNQKRHLRRSKLPRCSRCRGFAIRDQIKLKFQNVNEV
jgi:hypothetical protein